MPRIDGVGGGSGGRSGAVVPGSIIQGVAKWAAK